MIVLNILPPGDRLESVEVVWLETLSKKNIIKRWTEALAYPNRYIVAEAESIKKMTGDTPTAELTTVPEYLEEQGVEVPDKGDFARLTNNVAKLYKEQYKVTPRMIARPDSRGLYMKKSYAYEDVDLGLIEKALHTVEHVRKPKVK